MKVIQSRFIILRMETSDRIRQRLKELGLKSVDISKATGISSGGVSHWLNGNSKPRGGNLIKLSKLLMCQPEWLLTGEGAMDDVHPDLKRAEAYENNTPAASNEVLIPFFEEVQLAAGVGLASIFDSTTEKARINLDVLTTQGVPSSAVVSCRVSGNSMESKIVDGAKIFIDTRTTRIIDGKIYALEYGGLLRVKYLFRLPFSGVRIRSENSEDYPDEDLSPEEAKHLRIIGRVFWQEAAL
ncbi:S24 family peptidase [Marinomonas sp.]